MRRRSSLLLLPAVVAGAGIGVSRSEAEPVQFQIVAQTITVDRSNQTATFTLTFNRAPDFGSQGDPARQPDAFQYEIDADWSGFDGSPRVDYSAVDTVLRGSELFEGNGLPIRNRDGNGGVFSGGWGPVREFVPVNIDDNAVSFTTAWGAIGDTDGRFRYRLFTTEAGQMTSEINGAVIPLPPAIVSGGIVIAGLAAFRKRRSTVAAPPA